MIWKTVSLDLSTKQVKALKEQYAKVLRHLEDKLPLRLSVLADLQQELSQAAAGTKALSEILQQIGDSGDHVAVQLLHDDNEILNLPWAFAEAPQTDRLLGDQPQLYLSKCLTALTNEKDIAPQAPLDSHPTGPPLKILIMIASPKDADHENRLAYEQEEFRILHAFQPLLQTGQVEIDFTDDGSLEALQRKLASNRYHILHFSGHSLFKDGKGYLQLENPLTLRTELATSEAFAQAVNGNPDYRVPLVLLASCQSAQGSTETGLRGITNQLLQIGVPAVISMGLSIRDHYATIFSAHFYRQMAEKQNIPFAFKSALARLREQEHDDLMQARAEQPVPLQWIIPNLYLAGRLAHLIDWQAPQETLHFSSYRFITEQNRLLLRHEQNYLFIGRREEKAHILAPLFANTPVLLKGQGGVGKTAMAEYGVQRLIAANPRTQPYLFGETVRSLQDAITILQNDLIAQGQTGLVSELARIDKGLEKWQFLVSAAAKTCRPVFVFDNLETFQRAPGERFAEPYSDLEQAIQLLCRLQKFPVLLTCRYPLADFPNLQSFDLNQVGLTDFWRKCHELALSRLQAELLTGKHRKKPVGVLERPGVQFIDIVKLLHRTFGGNYRALEFFDALYREAPEKIGAALDSLEKLQAQIAQESEQVAAKMRDNLMLNRLMSLLEPEHESLLHLLCRFRIPVQEFALHLQWLQGDAAPPDEPAAVLQKLHDLTLLEISLDRQTRQAYYYATPIVRDMAAAQKSKAAPAFSPYQAGVYHYHAYQNIEPALTELEEAFYHFDAAQAKPRLQAIGQTLSGFYYRFSLFQNAFYYAGRVYEVLGDETSAWTLNQLGLILDLFGKFDEALGFYTSAFEKYKHAGDKSGEGTTLNNISQIYSARGDHDTALTYLKQSLKIQQEIGDKSGEGTTLNNISQIYSARGDYDTALTYLKQSLKIRQEIGDKSGEGTTLNNISQIYSARGDYDTALTYLEQVLIIIRKLGDKQREGGTLNNISQIYDARGDYDTALTYLKQSLKIRQEIGDKSGEGTTLNNMATTAHARGDYDTALTYLKQSLKISQEIGDKSGEGKTLNNISQIYSARGDYDTALTYLKQSLKISQEIGDKSTEGKTLNNISQIYDARGDYDTALTYLEQSLKISQEIGDKSGEAYTLFNLAMTYFQELDEKEKAMDMFAEVVAINAFLKDAQLTKALQQMGLGAEK